MWEKLTRRQRARPVQYAAGNALLQHKVQESPDGHEGESSDEQGLGESTCNRPCTPRKLQKRRHQHGRHRGQ